MAYNKPRPKEVDIPVKTMVYEISDNISPDLLSKGAKDIAQTFAKKYYKLDNKGELKVKRTNQVDKPTQIRKFYDEIVKLDARCQQNDFDFVKLDIHMLAPKSAYAKGREHISFNFDYFIQQGIKQITCEKSLNNFKLLFESVLGFYKEMRPKD